jgi:methylated-DNA-[protein]-cysteine S-methyltransferase
MSFPAGRRLKPAWVVVVTTVARGRLPPQPSQYVAILDAPFARIGVRVHEEQVVGIDYLPMTRPLACPRIRSSRSSASSLGAYLKDPRHQFDLPRGEFGTQFQRRVWDVISAIPSGSTRTYGDVAARLGSAARAVGGACGSNPIPLIIPCHRIVAASGALGGFMHSRAAFPLDIKRWLLAHEAR